MTGALLSIINHSGSPNGKPDPISKPKPRKQQNKNFSVVVPAKVDNVEKKEADANKENSNKSNVAATKGNSNKKEDNTIDTQQGENGVKKRTRKRNYSPLVPPGEWVCPEMKIALENLYNKMNLSTIKEDFSINGQHPGSIEVWVFFVVVKNSILDFNKVKKEREAMFDE